MRSKINIVVGAALLLTLMPCSNILATEELAVATEENASDVNSLIEAAVSQAIASEVKVFTDAVSQEQYEDMHLTWNYSGTEFSDLLTDVDAPDFKAHYEYGDDFRRISKNVDGETTYYVWSGDGELISEVNDNYAVDYRYVHGLLIGFEYNSKDYDYIFDDEYTIVGLKHNGSVICEYEYQDDVLYAVYQLDENGGKFLNTNPLYAGNVNGYKYKNNYVDSETGWIYSGRYVDWKNGRYVDGLACADMQRYIEEAGDITPEIMYRINDIGIGGSKSEESDGSENVGLCTYSNDKDTMTYAEQQIDELQAIARTIWFESGKDANDQLGVAQVIQNRMSRDSLSAFEVVSGGEFTAYNEMVLKGKLPDETSSVWSQALENARRLKRKTSLVYHISWYDNVYYFMGLNNIVNDDPPKIKYLNGTKMHARVNTTAGYVYVPIKDVYTPVYENGVSYASGYITSIEVLALLSARYGSWCKYNVFYKLA